MRERSERRNPSWTASRDRKSTRLNSSHLVISYAVFCLKKKRRRPRRGSPARSQPLGSESPPTASLDRTGYTIIPARNQLRIKLFLRQRFKLFNPAVSH